MSRPIKIVLYVVCITMTVSFGVLAKQEFRKAAAAKEKRQQKLDDAASIENTNRVTETTNVLAEATNAVATNVAAAGETNGLATNVSSIPASRAGADAAKAIGPPSYSRMITYILLCAAGFVG